MKFEILNHKDIIAAAVLKEDPVFEAIHTRGLPEFAPTISLTKGGPAPKWRRMDRVEMAAFAKGGVSKKIDKQVAEVERWLVDSTAEMPEVLRG